MNRNALRTTLTVLLVTLAILSLGAGAFQSAMSVKVPKVEISGAWARIGLEGGNSAVYFTIVNKEGRDLRLVGAETNVTPVAELHRTAVGSDQVMRMELVPEIEIPAGAAATFEPGGLHVMLIGLQKPLFEGEDILLRLLFEGYDPLSIAVGVRAAGPASEGAAGEAGGGTGLDHGH